MYGCFSITAPANSRITYVDFIGMDPDNTRNCRDLLSGPFEDNTDSSSESMNGPWEDNEGRTKLYFKYVFNPAAVGSAYIKQIILHLDTDDSNPDEGDENGDIENGGDENGGDETPSLIELRSCQDQESAPGHSSQDLARNRCCPWCSFRGRPQCT